MTPHSHTPKAGPVVLFPVDTNWRQEWVCLVCGIGVAALCLHILIPLTTGRMLFQVEVPVRHWKGRSVQSLEEMSQYWEREK